jgi:hypothetical protein
MKWSYGVTTVLSRREDLLPQTLGSLARAGFDRPHLFVDGGGAWDSFGLDVTQRTPNVGVAGHWVLSLYELYVKAPSADRFALFQDDLLACVGLREYLSRCPFPERGYLNLFTFPSNTLVCPVEDGRRVMGWFRSRVLDQKKDPIAQTGRGAVGLVFSREGVQTILSSRLLAERPTDVARGHRAIDGGVVNAMNAAGWSEYVHNPSLLYHTGERSAMGNVPHRQTDVWNGENWNPLTLLRDVGEI